MGSPLRSLIHKEFLALLRDPRTRVILIVPPIVQLLVFAFAATLEVRNIDVAVLNQDSGRWGAELVRRIDGAPAFARILRVDRPGALREAIDRQRVLAAIRIGPQFSRDLAAGRGATLQIVLDGRRSNAAQIVSGYLGQIAGGLAAEALPPPRGAPARVAVLPRNWFNPNLEYTWFTVPSLIAIIALLVGLVVTALSIARERELGTFDQLLVSPLQTGQLLIGKLTPPLLIGLVHVTIYVLVAVLLFGVPLRGSLLTLYAGALVYLAAVAGVGLFISSLCMTQQQAILGAFLFMVPAVLLSGFATPIENMPPWLQTVTYLDPLRYFLELVQGVFLKALPMREALRDIAPMTLIAATTLGAAAWLFRRRLP